MSGLAKRIIITLVLLSLPFIVGLLITYEVIKIDWISFMEIQPSYKHLEDSLPPPAGSVPIQGAAYLPGMGAPLNPVQANAASVERGARLYEITCLHCHGPQGHGDGPVTVELLRKPADLTSPTVRNLADGDIFIILTNGLKMVPGFKGGMPGLKDSLAAGDRWDVVNYVRSLQSQAASQ
jgi:mono/diheme cytochrome c family protein